MIRFVLWLALGTLALSGCGTTAQRCSAVTCTGCCDSSGMCRSGSDSSACGTSGNSCTACTVGSFCSFGTCSAGNNTGAGPSGGGFVASGGSSGTGGGSSSGTVTDWASWCQLAMAAVGNFYGRCGEYTQQGATEAIQTNTAACLARPPPGLADGRARLNTAGAQSCLTLFNGRTCAEGLPSGCQPLLTGLVARNGSCFETAECDATSWCDDSTTCPGRCVARVAIGQPALGNAYCVDGAYAYNGLCTALVPMGQSCAPTGGSTQTRACLDGQCTNNVCGPRIPDVGEGATCTLNTSPECARGLQCVANRCVQLVDLNGACDSARRCKVDLQCGPANVCVRASLAGGMCGGSLSCAAGLFCNRPAGATAGSCLPLKQTNETCTNSFQCAASLYCTNTLAQPNGVCRAKGTVSAPCTYDARFSACAEGLYCTATSASPNGVCANRKGATATCIDSEECQSRSCVTGRCTMPPCEDPTP